MMARRSIRKRRHRHRRSLAEIIDIADREFLAQAAVFEEWFYALVLTVHNTGAQ
jgi:hypothetical protein